MVRKFSIESETDVVKPKEESQGPQENAVENNSPEKGDGAAPKPVDA